MRFDNIGGYERLKQQLQDGRRKNDCHTPFCCVAQMVVEPGPALALAQYVNCLSSKDGEPLRTLPFLCQIQHSGTPRPLFLLPYCGRRQDFYRRFLLFGESMPRNPTYHPPTGYKPSRPGTVDLSFTARKVNRLTTNPLPNCRGAIQGPYHLAAERMHENVEQQALEIYRGTTKTHAYTTGFY